jgi:hypothetical protein
MEKKDINDQKLYASITSHMPKIIQIHPCLLKLSHKQESVTDRQTDGRYYYIPHRYRGGIQIYLMKMNLDIRMNKQARVLGENLYLHQRFTQCSKWSTSFILFRSCCNILHPSNKVCYTLRHTLLEGWSILQHDLNNIKEVLHFEHCVNL